MSLPLFDMFSEKLSQIIPVSNLLLLLLCTLVHIYVIEMLYSFVLLFYNVELFCIPFYRSEILVKT